MGVLLLDLNCSWLCMFINGSAFVGLKLFMVVYIYYWFI